MPRKRPDLNKRLAEIRQEPPPPVDITLRLDDDLHQALKALARRHRQPLEAYLIRILRQHSSGEG